eukprot:658995-Rhodomonas_salina.2
MQDTARAWTSDGSCVSSKSSYLRSVRVDAQRPRPEGSTDSRFCVTSRLSRWRSRSMCPAEHTYPGSISSWFWLRSSTRSSVQSHSSSATTCKPFPAARSSRSSPSCPTSGSSTAIWFREIESDVSPERRQTTEGTPPKRLPSRLR